MCDTGPLVAAVSRNDRHHELCQTLLERDRDRNALVVPSTVAVEVDYLLRARVGTAAARDFLSDLDEGPYLLQPMDVALLSRARAIDLQYADANLGLVDASVLAIAERLSADRIATLDHRDFCLAGSGSWSLLPDESQL